MSNRKTVEEVISEFESPETSGWEFSSDLGGLLSNGAHYLRILLTTNTRLEAELDKHRWRRVEDEVPEEHQDCLVHIPYEEEPLETAFFEGGNFRSHSLYGSPKVPGVTHWKPITPPEIGG